MAEQPDDAARDDSSENEEHPSRFFENASDGPERRGRWRYARPSRRDLHAGLIVIVAMVLSGFITGALWQHFGSHAQGTVLAASDGTLLNVGETEHLIAADGWFALFTGAAGIIAAVIVWLWRETRGPFVMVCLVAGGVLSSLFASWFGSWLDGPVKTVQVPGFGSARSLPLQLGATSAIVVEGFCALAVYVLCAAFSFHDELGRSERAPE